MSITENQREPRHRFRIIRADEVRGPRLVISKRVKMAKKPLDV